MDFSFEKTNSAYMLFYERIASTSGSSDAGSEHSSIRKSETIVRPHRESTSTVDDQEIAVEMGEVEKGGEEDSELVKVQLSKELADVSDCW